MTDLEEQFYIKQDMIFDALKDGQIEYDEFYAELDALSRWYIKERRAGNSASQEDE